MTKITTKRYFKTRKLKALPEITTKSYFKTKKLMALPEITTKSYFKTKKIVALPSTLSELPHYLKFFSYSTNYSIIL